MKKTKILPIICAMAVMAPLAIGVGGCYGNNKNFNVDAKEVYAMSAASSVNYLNQMEKSFSNAPLIFAEPATSRPNHISKDAVNGMKDCLTMFDEMIQNGGVSQNTDKNTNTETDLRGYNFVMTISVAGSEEFKMYYNETETETNREVEDETEEVEVSTKLEGIMVSGTTEYTVFGERTFETEGNEKEATIEFTTKSKTNPNNYIVVSQTVENDEIEYEYKIYDNGHKVQDTEVEIEYENGKMELEFELVNSLDSNRTRYLIKQGASENTFEVVCNINANKDIINVEKTETGYKFTYENGYSEII